MLKKIVSALSVAVVFLLLTASPAVAASECHSTALAASNVARASSTWLPTFLQEIMTWLAAELSASELQPSTQMSSDSGTQGDSGEAAPSGPGIGVTPMAGADLDPDG